MPPSREVAPASGGPPGRAGQPSRRRRHKLEAAASAGIAFALVVVGLIGMVEQAVKVNIIGIGWGAAVVASGLWLARDAKRRWDTGQGEYKAVRAAAASAMAMFSLALALVLMVAIVFIAFRLL